jgi:hypothetical protein
VKANPIARPVVLIVVVADRPHPVGEVQVRRSDHALSFEPFVGDVTACLLPPEELARQAAERVCARSK